MQVLLNKQDADTRLFNDALNSPLDIKDDRGLNTLGGLIQQKQLGLTKQRTRDSQLLLLTTTQVTSTPIQKVLKNGEEFINEGIDMAIFAHATGQSFHTKHQVLANRQAGNDVPPLGHISNAMAGTAIRGLLQQLI